MNTTTPREGVSLRDLSPRRLALCRVPTAEYIVELVNSLTKLGTAAKLGDVEEIVPQDPEQLPTKHRLFPLHTIASIVYGQLAAKTIICQNPIEDADYGDEYKAFYSTTFLAHSRSCSRLHFFSLEAQKDESPLAFLDRIALSSAAPAQAPRNTFGYLGFLTVRPIRTCPVGTTILATPPGCGFITIKDQFRVTIAGHEFYVEGTPFMQQDSSVGACVQASAWMALRASRKRDGRQAVYVSDITLAANARETYSRIFPSRDGLNAAQLMRALDTFGYHGMGIRFNDPSDVKTESDKKKVSRIKAALYPYIESSIPVILQCQVEAEGKREKHAVLLIGHGWCRQDKTHIHFRDKWVDGHEIHLKSGSIKFEFPSSIMIGSYFINNDNSGPYLELSDERGKGNLCIEDVEYAFPLLTKEIYIDGGEVLEVAKRILGDTFSDLIENGHLSFGDIDETLVLRPKLMRRHDFRRWAKSNPSTELMNYYRRKQYPSSIWVVALNSYHDYASAHNGNSKQLGEIVLDPTGDIDDFPLLSLHINIKALRLAKALPANDQTDISVIVDFDKETRKISIAFYPGSEGTRII